jgi:hypothetical protein
MTIRVRLEDSLSSTLWKYSGKSAVYMVSTGSNGGEKNLLFIEYLKLMPIISKIKKD